MEPLVLNSLRFHYQLLFSKTQQLGKTWGTFKSVTYRSEVNPTTNS